MYSLVGRFDFSPLTPLSGLSWPRFAKSGQLRNWEINRTFIHTRIHVSKYILWNKYGHEYITVCMHTVQCTLYMLWIIYILFYTYSTSHAYFIYSTHQKHFPLCERTLSLCSSQYVNFRIFCIYCTVRATSISSNDSYDTVYRNRNLQAKFVPVEQFEIKL